MPGTMKKLLLFLLFVVAAVPAQDSKPDISTGNGFQNKCAVVADKDVQSLTGIETNDLVYCLGYVTGLHDGMLVVEAVRNKFYCLPDGVTTGQILSILVKYVHENPETAHERTAILFMGALKRAFPCK
jgi:hypothetical protein